MTTGRRLFVAAILGGVLASPARAGGAKILLVGGPGVGPAPHEYGRGLAALGEVLARVAGARPVQQARWPSTAALAGTRSLVLFCDGGRHHPLVEPKRLAALERYLARGGGLVVIHSALLADGPTGERLRAWLGGGFDSRRSKLPLSVWPAGFDTLPAHPITRGIAPFSIDDEWFLGLELSGGGGRLTPLLSALPPEFATTGKLTEQPIAWSYERPTGGRSFALSGGHYLSNWQDPSFIRLVANAALWTAAVEVPSQGAPLAISRR